MTPDGMKCIPSLINIGPNFGEGAAHTDTHTRDSKVILHYKPTYIF
jgi:hypothetical protein